MATPDGFGMHGFDPAEWCGRLAGVVQYLLSDDADLDFGLKYARIQLREYDEALECAAAARERADNVVPLRPFSMRALINEVTHNGGDES